MKNCLFTDNCKYEILIYQEGNNIFYCSVYNLFIFDPKLINIDVDCKFCCKK